MAQTLTSAPRESARLARKPLVISLPGPNGRFQRFAVQESPIMEPGLAARHPDIRTYSGRGIDEPAATIRFDLTPLGFHAQVGSPTGWWYIDPYYHRDQSLYVSYFGRDLTESPHGDFTESANGPAEVTTDRPYYHPDETVDLHGNGFEPNATVALTIRDPLGVFPPRETETTVGDDGSFVVSFPADPDGALGTHVVDADDGTNQTSASYDVVTAEDESVDPPTGDQLRTYRLALITDPGYAAFFGPANVTAAKVTLMNRVNQVYEQDLSIRIVLVANNDLLNFNTWARPPPPTARAAPPRASRSPRSRRA